MARQVVEHSINQVIADDDPAIPTKRQLTSDFPRVRRPRMLMVMESPVKYFQRVERESFQVMVLPDGPPRCGFW